MESFVQEQLQQLDGRIEQIRAELSQLEKAADALRNGKPPTHPRTGGRPAAGKRAKKRADQAVELIGKHPGITIPQLADRMGIAPNYLYRVVPALAEAGQVRRDGEGWHPANRK